MNGFHANSRGLRVDAERPDKKSKRFPIALKGCTRKVLAGYTTNEKGPGDCPGPTSWPKPAYGVRVVGVCGVPAGGGVVVPSVSSIMRVSSCAGAIIGSVVVVGAGSTVGDAAGISVVVSSTRASSWGAQAAIPMRPAKASAVKMRFFMVSSIVCEIHSGAMPVAPPAVPRQREPRRVAGSPAWRPGECTLDKATAVPGSATSPSSGKNPHDCLHFLRVARSRSRVQRRSYMPGERSVNAADRSLNGGVAQRQRLYLSSWSA